MFPQAQGFALLLADPAGNLLIKAGLEIEAMIVALRALRREATQQRQPWLFRPEGQSPFSQYLTAPLMDAQELRGLLVLATSQKDGFGPADIDRLHLLTKGYGEELRDLEVVSSPKSQPSAAARLPNWKVSALVGSCVLVGLAISRMQARPTPQLSQTPGLTLQSAEPVQISRTLLQEAARGDSEKVYMLCSQDFKKHWPAPKFSQEFQKWKQSKGGRWELSYRSATIQSQTEDQAIVVIQPSPKLGSAATWTWELCREKGSWKLVRFSKGPFCHLEMNS